MAVANAGIQLFGQDAPVADLDLEVWRRTIDVNLTGTFLTLKHAVRAMRQRGGSIIVTGSPTGLNGEGSQFTAYSSSKAGMHGMARAVAAAYASAGIRVNTVVPGYTETPLVTAISSSPEDRAAIDLPHPARPAWPGRGRRGDHGRPRQRRVVLRHRRHLARGDGHDEIDGRWHDG